MKKLLITCTALLSLLAVTNSIYAQWQNMIKKDLSNWEQLNGTAPFKLENGTGYRNHSH